MSSNSPHLAKPALRILPPKNPLRGKITPPGSKSITNRALLLAALAQGESRLSGALASEDTARMAEALTEMGIAIRSSDSSLFIVKGTGRLQKPAKPLFLGNAGTATRFLTAAVSLADGETKIDGDANMRKRPIDPLLKALAGLGVRTKSVNGCPPVTVYGSGKIKGGAVQIDASLSSQYVSALLMLLACAETESEVTLLGDTLNAKGYVDLTLACMRSFGAEAAAEGPARWRVKPTGYKACDFKVEPDASAATYLWAAERLTGGCIDLGLAPEDFTQPDARARHLIAQFPNMPFAIDGSQMQDAIPTLAVMAAFNHTPVRFTGIGNLRVKECDRIRALSTELCRIQPGLGLEEGDDLIVTGDPALAGRKVSARIETYSDHRIAMSFALAGLLIDGLTILDPGCVAKTYPKFWDDLASLGVELEG